jgi:fimbrial chaperone protein
VHAARSFLAGFALAATGALAGSFQVSPVRVALTAEAPTAAIAVRNESKTDPVVVQLRPVDWRQQDGEDRYEPSATLIATPPIFTLAPGGTQTVRVGLRRAEPGAVQRSFRLYITEVPAAPRRGFQGLQVALNIGIPVFVHPKERTGGPLAFRAGAPAGRTLALKATNPANAHVQLIEARLLDEGDGVLATTGQPRYLLAGQTATWRLELARQPKGRLRIEARTDAGPLAVPVEPETGTAKP